MKRILRPHQVEALSLLKASLLAGHRRPIIQAATGFGKTLLSAAIVEGALAKGNRVIFTVPALSLIDQTVQAFFDEGIHDVGVLQGNHPMTDASKPVQVASVQTLQRRKLPEADIVIVDEAHRMFEFYGKWMADPEWASIPFVGLSATPWTKGLGKHFDDLIIAATTADLIEKGFLAPFRVFAPSHPDLSKVRTVAGDYHEGDLSDAMDQPTLVADAVSTWLKLGEGRPTLCFGVDRAHAKKLTEQFERAGVPTGYIDAHTPADERARIGRRLRDGQIKVVCNVGCLTTGVDWDVRCIILARPTKSEILYTQIIGRGLRTAEGKRDCLILDHSDTTMRLGFVTDIQRDTLDGGKQNKSQQSRKKAAPLPKECPSCAYLKPAGIHKCPNCGFAPERQSSVEVQDGELAELSSRNQAKRNREAPWIEKVNFIGQLRFIAQERGRSPGWVAHAYKKKFGVWPNDPRVRDAPPTHGASMEVRSWVKAQDIAFAKRKEKQREQAEVAHAA